MIKWILRFLLARMETVMTGMCGNTEENASCIALSLKLILSFYNILDIFKEKFHTNDQELWRYRKLLLPICKIVTKYSQLLL